MTDEDATIVKYTHRMTEALMAGLGTTVIMNILRDAMNAAYDDGFDAAREG